ncbi:hypothetical protein BK816_00290 [Boudabousia tangfeifanii]|uniref:Uncharacterized protein n=1 Tax=Boudabousia tangfeifanii TaxID=1912795 RepID=A0A1D9MHY1_9ACTO|nr:DUF5979 domain-containing protein [Boudabousia tangfeifanii]AOZ71921.1 hypothetical protein BK816_00290 [Boudabousia tangfeifanii]
MKDTKKASRRSLVNFAAIGSTVAVALAMLVPTYFGLGANARTATAVEGVELTVPDISMAVSNPRIANDPEKGVEITRDGCLRTGLGIEHRTTETVWNGQNNWLDSYERWLTATPNNRPTEWSYVARGKEPIYPLPRCPQYMDLNKQTSLGIQPNNPGRVTAGKPFVLGRIRHNNIEVSYLVNGMDNTFKYLRANFKMRLGDKEDIFPWTQFETFNEKVIGNPPNETVLYTCELGSVAPDGSGRGKGKVDPLQKHCSDDILTLSKTVSDKLSIVENGVKYDLNVRGFVEAGPDGQCPEDPALSDNKSKFITAEKKDTIACIYASFDEERPVKIAKQVERDGNAAVQIPSVNFTKDIPGLWETAYDTLTPSGWGEAGKAVSDRIINVVPNGENIKVKEERLVPARRGDDGDGWQLEAIKCTDGVGQEIPIPADKIDLDKGTIDLSAIPAAKSAAAIPVTCTFVNRYRTTTPPPRLTIIKKVVGGSAQPSDWTFVAELQPRSADYVLHSGETKEIAPGAYILNEYEGPDGYEQFGDWECVSDEGNGRLEKPNRVILDNGDHLTCTITNKLKASDLVLEKKLTGDRAGLKPDARFKIHYTCTGDELSTPLKGVAELAVDETKTVSDVPLGSVCTVEEEPPTADMLNGPLYQWNPYTVTRDGDYEMRRARTSVFGGGAYYTKVYEGSNKVTVTNSIRSGSQVTLEKRILDSNGREIASTDERFGAQNWMLKYSDALSRHAASADDDEAHRTWMVEPGKFTISEAGLTETAKLFTQKSVNCEVQRSGESDYSPLPANPTGDYTINSGEKVKCVFVNQLRAPKLVLTKQVTGAGTEVPGGDRNDWRLIARLDGSRLARLDGTGQVQGTVNAGTYQLSETAASRYDDLSAFTRGEWQCKRIEMERNTLGDAAPDPDQPLQGFPRAVEVQNAEGGNGTLQVDEGYDYSCVIVNTMRNTSFVIEKVVTGEKAGLVDPDTTFNISYRCTSDVLPAPLTGTATLADGDTKRVDNVPVGANCVVSEAKPATELLVDSSYRWADPVISPAPLTVAMGGENKVTVTNRIDRDRGTLRLVKVLLDTNGQEVESVGRVTPYTWILTASRTDSSDVVTGRTGVEGTVPAGRYTLSENDRGRAPGFSQVGVSCVKNLGNGRTEPTGSGTSVDVANGDDITCTFRNQRDGGSITLLKKVVGEGKLEPRETWTLEARQLGSVNPEVSGKHGVKGTNLPTGTYRLNETPDNVPGYVLVNWQCQNADGIPVQLGIGNSFELQKGDDITCTATNRRTEGPAFNVKKEAAQDEVTVNVAEKTFVATYNVTIENKGTVAEMPGDLTERPKFPNGFNITNVEISRDGQALPATSRDGVWTVTSETLGEMQPQAKQVLKVTITGTVDLEKAKQLTPADLVCQNVRPGDLNSATGGYNRVELSTEKPGEDGDNDACEPIKPKFSVSKSTGESPDAPMVNVVNNNDGTYTAIYSVVVRNDSLVPGEIPVIRDTPTFPAGAEIKSVEFSSEGKTSVPLPQERDLIKVARTSTELKGLESKVYTVKYVLSFGPAANKLTQEAFTCKTTDTFETENPSGFFNKVVLEGDNVADRTDDNIACENLPPVWEVAKRDTDATSVVPPAEGPVELPYTVTVYNRNPYAATPTGLLDLMTPPAGYAIESVKVVNPEGITFTPAQPAEDPAGTYRFNINGVGQIAGNGELEINVIINAVVKDKEKVEKLTPADLVCKDANPPTDTDKTAMFNQVLVDNEPGDKLTDNQACISLSPAFKLRKENVEESPVVDGNTITVKYRVVVSNTTGVKGAVPTITDTPNFGKGFVPTNARVDGQTVPVTTDETTGQLKFELPTEQDGQIMLEPGQEKSWLVEMDVNIDPAVPNFSAENGICEGKAGEGFTPAKGLYNKVSFNDAPDGDGEANNEACQNLTPKLSVKKTNAADENGAQPNGGSASYDPETDTYTSAYVVTLQNESIIPTRNTADVIDVNTFPAGVKLLEVTVAENGGAPSENRLEELQENGKLLLQAANTSQVLAGKGTGETPAAGSFVKYTVTYKYQVDTADKSYDETKFVCAADQNYDTANPSGLVNKVNMEADSDGTTNNYACQNLTPRLRIQKDITTNGGESGENQTFEVIYDIKVTNDGDLPGDTGVLTDTPKFAPGLIINSVEKGEAGKNGEFVFTKTEIGADGNIPLSNGLVIKPGENNAKYFKLRFNVTLDPSVPEYNEEALACEANNETVYTPAKGLFNRVNMDLQKDSDGAKNNVACGPVNPGAGKKVVKIIKQGQEGNLDGAEFALYPVDPSTPDAKPLENGVTRGAAVGEFVTAALDLNKDYWLVETKAPYGHLLLAKPVKFHLGPEGIVTDNEIATGAITVTVSNAENGPTITVTDLEAGQLPKSGGIGQLPYVLVTLLLLGAAGAIQFTSSRRRRELV